MIIKFLIVLPIIAATRAAYLPYADDAEDVMYLGSPVMLTEVREKRSAYPSRAMMFHGYFGHPYQVPQQTYPSNGRSYDPQGAMTAFAAGDSVAAGSSYYGNGGGHDCSNCKKPSNGNGKKNGNGNGHGHGNGHPVNGNGHPVNGNGYPTNGNGYPANGNGYPQTDVPAEVPVAKPESEEKPVEGQEPGNGGENEVPQGNGEEGYLGDQPAAEETPKGETLPPAIPTEAAPTAPQGPKKIPAGDSDEEEDEPSFFSHKGRGRGPYYNSYFPMVFGAFPGYGGGRGGNRDEEGGAYNPGVATAIANSFSTGRGAVATSHATAYGGPQFVPSGYRKNGSRTRPQSA